MYFILTSNVVFMVLGNKKGLKKNELSYYLPPFVFMQQKHLEVERVSKWLKMIKSWDKYKNSDKVTSHTSQFSHMTLGFIIHSESIENKMK